jgi:hypothetical protein
MVPGVARWTAIAAALVVMACAGAAPGTSDPNGESPGSIRMGRTAAPVYDFPNDLEVGGCFDPISDKDDGSLLAAEIRSCESPHLMELTARPTLAAPEGAPWPGAPVVESEADLLCTDAFLEYVGIARIASTLTLVYYFPGEEEWVLADRTVLCAVEADPAQPFTESVRGSGR